MAVRVADVRLAMFLEFLHFATNRRDSGQQRAALDEAFQFADSCSRSVLRLGWCVSNQQTWTLTAASLSYPRLWSTVIHAALLAGIRHCLGARIGSGMHHLQHLPEMPDSLLIW